MNIEQITSELETCKANFQTIFSRSNYIETSCLLLRLESKGEIFPDNGAIQRMIPGKPFIPITHFMPGDNYTTVFYPKSTADTRFDIKGQLERTGEAADEVVSLLSRIPKDIIEDLRIPNTRIGKGVRSLIGGMGDLCDRFRSSGHQYFVSDFRSVESP